MIGCRKCIADRPDFRLGAPMSAASAGKPAAARTDLDPAERRADRSPARSAAGPELLLPQRADRAVGARPAAGRPRGLPLRRRGRGVARARRAAPRSRSAWATSCCSRPASRTRVSSAIGVACRNVHELPYETVGGRAMLLRHGGDGRADGARLRRRALRGSGGASAGRPDARRAAHPRRPGRRGAPAAADAGGDGHRRR